MNVSRNIFHPNQSIAKFDLGFRIDSKWVWKMGINFVVTVVWVLI